MARFNEVLNELGDSELPEEFLTKLMSAYDEDLSIPVAKIGELETANQELATTVGTLKAQNYDLVRAGGGFDNNVSADPSDTGNDDDEVVTIDDLFEY